MQAYIIHILYVYKHDEHEPSKHMSGGSCILHRLLYDEMHDRKYDFEYDSVLI